MNKQMSSSIVKAHTSGHMLGGIIHDTMTNVPRDVREKHLDRLIANTTGTPKGKPIMEGVIDSTIPKHMKDVPELHKIASHEVGKTKTNRMGQVPYSGKYY